MNDQELIKKLNSLKTVKPDDGWKKNHRDVLYSQISSGNSFSPSESNLKVIWESILPREIIIGLTRPVWMVGAACVLILAVCIGSVYASRNSRPGDSLYIAKLISQKTQLAITFNENDKAKLSLGFAANRAKEITQVLKDSSDSDTTKVETLTKDFKKEISQAKTNLSAIKSTTPQNKEDEQVFGANLGKDDQGMEIAEPAKPEIKENNEITVASSTPASKQADQILEEAEKMFDEKDYDGAINKLEEVNKIINQADNGNESGQVKGESETASSTIEN